MPPKKDPGKKPADTETSPTEDSEKELIEKELVISCLKSKLGRYQEQGDRLQVDLLKAVGELDTQKQNLSDISEYLTNELKAKNQQIEALEEQVATLTETVSQERTSYEKERKKQAEEIAKQVEALQYKENELNKKIKGAQEFLERKEQFEADYKKLQQDLKEQRDSSQLKLSDIERQHVQEKDRWKKDLERRIKETKVYMMALTDKQLEMTTKRTILENEQMASELAYQSRQTERLISKNQKLVEDCVAQQLHLDVAKQTHEELAKRNTAYQRALAMILGKLQQEDTIKASEADGVRSLAQHCQDVSEMLELSRHEATQAQTSLQQAEAELEKLKAAEAQRHADQHEVARFLLKCMEDVKERVVHVRRHADHGERVVEFSQGQLDALAPDQRERVLTYLLARLNAFQATAQHHSSLTPDQLQAISLSPIKAPHTATAMHALAAEYSRSSAHLNELSTHTRSQSVVTSSPSGVVGKRTVGIQVQTGGSRDVDALFSTVLSEVRPWERMADEQPLRLKTQETFLRKRAGISPHVSKGS